MIDSLLTTAWALEPGFHNAMGLIAIRRLSQGKEPFNTAEMAEKVMPYVLNSKPATQAAAVSQVIGIEAPANAEPSPSKKIMVIPIIGVLTRYGGMCSHGTESLAGWIVETNATAAEYGYDGILLEINSPGGTVDGMQVLIEAIKQSELPVHAYVTGMAASAAYWVASQCASITLESKTASSVGSIGVMAQHIDASKHLENEGYKVTIIRAEGSENKALFNSVEPVSAELIAEYRAEMKPMRDLFIGDIRANRPYSL